jgi:2-iminobutanoate/2-iminopropanoate deaminase
MRLVKLNRSHLKFSFGVLAAATLLSGLSSCQQVQKAQIIRHEMNPPWEAVNGYTQVVEVNGTVYLSGVACSGESYAKAIPDCYSQLKVQLDKLNLTPANIVKETVFTKSIEGLKEQVPARKDFYGNANYPAATWIEISRLFLPEHLVEVDVIAVRTK